MYKSFLVSFNPFLHVSFSYLAEENSEGHIRIVFRRTIISDHYTVRQLEVYSNFVENA